MSNENKEILDQVTELISSKKEIVKDRKIENKTNLEKPLGIDVDNKPENSEDLLIKREIEKWIQKNAEKLAKEIINEQAKKIFK